MSKISKLFKAIGLIISKPALLNNVLDDADVNKDEVVKKYGMTKGLKTVDITELCPAFSQTVEPYASLDGGSTPLDLALLKALAAGIPACNYFEIGTWRGESVANVASVAALCTTLNLPDEAMLEMGLDKKYVALHRFFSKDLKNVTHVYGNSLNFDYKPYHKKFDLVFVDGDHHYESVKSDTENAFRLLKDENSVIVWHDYGNNPSDVRWDVLRGILEGTPVGQQNKLYRVSNTLCAIYTGKQVNASYPEAFSDPKKTFSVRISAKS